MEDTAGICLRPSASLLVALNGGNPVVVGRSEGFRTGSERRVEPQAVPEKRKGFGGFLDRIAGMKAPEEADPNLFPFDRAGELLQKLEDATESTAPHRVVIAVPAYAHDGHRQSVISGATAAGWEVLGLVNEPVAAAMATGVLRDGDGTTVVYDLAEGRFDVSVVARRGDAFEVRSANGIMNMSDSATLPDLLNQTEDPCQRALGDAGLSADAIDSVVLVGEKSREALTVEFVTNLFGKTAPTRFDPEEVVGIGASVQASLLGARQGQ